MIEYLNKDTGEKFVASNLKEFLGQTKMSQSMYYRKFKKNLHPTYLKISETGRTEIKRKGKNVFYKQRNSGIYFKSESVHYAKIDMGLTNYAYYELFKKNLHPKYEISSEVEYLNYIEEDFYKQDSVGDENEEKILRVCIPYSYAEPEYKIVSLSNKNSVLNYSFEMTRNVKKRFDAVYTNSYIYELLDAVQTENLKEVQRICGYLDPSFEKFVTDNWYLDNVTVYFITNIDIENIDLEINREQEDEIFDFDLLNLKPEDYIIDGGKKRLPYINFENGSEKNCLYNYIKSRFVEPKRNPVPKNQFKLFIRKKNNTIKNLQNFCKKCKIRLELYNIFKKRIVFDENDGKNRKNIIAVVFNNNIYPLKSEKYSLKTKRFELNNTVIEDEEKHADCINLTKDGTVYNFAGFYGIEASKNKLEKEFFRINMNFFYSSEVDLKMRAVNMVPHFDNTDKIYYYDMKKAYYTMMEINKNGKFPIFTVFDTWKKYKNEEINDYSYYSIKIENFNKLAHLRDDDKITSIVKKSFLTQNFFHGFFLKELIKHDIIKIEDIEYTKNPSYLKAFKPYYDVIKKIDGKYKKQFVLYNGVLGRLRGIDGVVQKVDNCLENDIKLLINNYKDDPTKKYYIINTGENENNENIYEFILTPREKSKILNINTVSFYNFIVEYTNLKLLEKVSSVGFSKIRGMKTDSFAVEIKNNKYEDDLFIFEKKQIKGPIRYIYNPMILDIKNIKKSSEEELKEIFKSSKSYSGAPGTGKSYQIRNKENFDFGATISNICVRNMINGIDETENSEAKITTLFRMLSLYNPKLMRKIMYHKKNKTCWIDEGAYIQSYYYSFFFIMAKDYGIKFIFSYDCNQLTPVGENEAYDPQNKIFRIIMGQRKNLKKNYRCEKKLLNFSSHFDESRSKISNRSLFGATRKYFPDIFVRGTSIKKQVTAFDKKLDINIHLCWTNTYRKMINSAIMKKRGLTFKYKKISDEIIPKNFDLLRSKAEDVIPAKYSYKISAGCRLVAKNNSLKDGIYKSDLYEIIKDVDFGENFLCVQIHTGKILEFSNNKLSLMRLGFSFTIHSLQGITLNEKICIHQLEMILKCDQKRMVYVALTRARKFDQIDFFNTTMQQLLIKNYPPFKYSNEIKNEYDFEKLEGIEKIKKRL